MFRAPLVLSNTLFFLLLRSFQKKRGSGLNVKSQCDEPKIKVVYKECLAETHHATEEAEAAVCEINIVCRAIRLARAGKFGDNLDNKHANLSWMPGHAALQMTGHRMLVVKETPYEMSHREDWEHILPSYGESVVSGNAFLRLRQLH